MYPFSVEKAALAVAPVVLVLSSSIALAQAPAVAEEDEGTGATIEVKRIELTLFGGSQSGAQYLDLPALFDEIRTFDQGADDILDFQGAAMPSNIRAPRKEYETSPVLGGSASFYLGPSFGFQLYGSYTSTTAILTGFDINDPLEERFEVDTSDMTIMAGGTNIIYNLGNERKTKIRPYFQLGFGGILNQFPEQDDVGGLYFLYGAGLSLPIKGPVRFQAGAHYTLYSFDQDEIAQDSVINTPSFTIGLTWRHDVPEKVVVPADDSVSFDAAGR